MSESNKSSKDIFRFFLSPKKLKFKNFVASNENVNRCLKLLYDPEHQQRDQNGGMKFVMKIFKRKSVAVEETCLSVYLFVCLQAFCSVKLERASA